MGEVKRYDPDVSRHGDAYMDEMPDGDYVLHDDYASLEAENTDLRLQCGGMEMTIDELESENAKLRAELERRAVPAMEASKELACMARELRDYSASALAAYKLGGEQSAELQDKAEEYDSRAKRVAELSSLLASPPAPKADERPLYTCIGKGGEYRYMGTAIGAGDSRGELAEVYQDRTGQLFHRTPEDFMERMEPIAAARKGEGE